MSHDSGDNNYINEVKNSLAEISPTFCLAKWYQVTIHLQNGLTHSCHHPSPHKIDLRGLEENPSQLHNTLTKKKERKMMLEGKRPQGCDYCWRIEDSDQNSISDRVLKSSEDWAYPFFLKNKNFSFEENVNPKYLEVSFGHGCNFKCLYCSPFISSSILNEYKKFGTYDQLPFFDLDTLKKQELYPNSEDDNPYVDAFWKWWPSLVKDLLYFRITGGEPLLNKNTFKFLEYLQDNPMPNMVFSINSNLGVNDKVFNKFLNMISRIVEKKHLKRFDFFTSVDTFGKQAEYIRDGLNYENLVNNMKTFLKRMPESCKITVMCTYNILSVTHFRKFLKNLAQLKSEFRSLHDKSPRVTLDLPYLRHPDFLSLAALTPNFKKMILEDIQFLQSQQHENLGENWNFSHYETSKLERIYKWFTSLEETENRREMRKNFYLYINEVDRRRGKDFLRIFPEMHDFYHFCQDLVENDKESIEY